MIANLANALTEVARTIEPLGLDLTPEQLAELAAMRQKPRRIGSGKRWDMPGLSAEKVSAAEELFRQGLGQKQVAKRVGICIGSARIIQAAFKD